MTQKVIPYGYDSLDSYMRHITILKDGVGADREKKLSKIIKHSNSQEAKKKAIDELVSGNLGLVVKIAQQIHGSYSYGLTLMDLITEGNFWLFRAARYFSYKKKCRFSVYAYPIIRWRIWQFIYASTFIHIPMGLLDHRAKFKNLQKEFGSKLTKKILIDKLKVSEQAAQNMLNAFDIRVVSLDSDIKDEEGHDKNLFDKIEDESVLPPNIETDRILLREYLEKIGNKCLTEKEKRIVGLLFYDDARVSFGTVARQVNLSPQRIRQIYYRVMFKMKQELIKHWDIKHPEDRLDKEEMYEEATGQKGFCNAFRMREEYDSRYIKRLNMWQGKKDKKILGNLI